MEITDNMKRLCGVRSIFLPARSRSIFSFFVLKHRKETTQSATKAFYTRTSRIEFLSGRKRFCVMLLRRICACEYMKTVTFFANLIFLVFIFAPALCAFV